MKKAILFSIFYFLFSILVVQAAGLVPCQGLNCNWCNLMQLIKNVIDFMIYLAIPLAVVMIIYGGFMILTSGGALGTKESPGRMVNGRKIIWSAVVGLLIVLLSWLLLDTIIKIVAQGWQGIQGLVPWNQIKC